MYEGVTGGDGVATLGHPALNFVVAHRTDTWTTLAAAATWLSGRIGNPLLAVLAVAALTWRRRDWTPLLLVTGGLLGSLRLTVVGKRLAGRVRPPAELALPPLETSPSFPSGHTLNATVLAAMVAYVDCFTVQTRWARAVTTLACVAFPLLVGASRVYLGQHWLTDVLAGLLLGLAWALAVVATQRLWLQVRLSRSRLNEGGSSPAPDVPGGHDASQ